MKRNSGGYNPKEKAPTVWAYLQDAAARRSTVKDIFVWNGQG